MTRQIRRVTIVMLVLFTALFVNLNVLQVVRGDELANHQANRRLLIKEYEIERGPIIVGDTEIAHSEPTSGELKYLRVYEEPALYAHLTGYYSFVVARAGLEQALNDQLRGTPTELLAQNLAELVVGRDEAGNTVQLTIDPRVQLAARSALGDRIGAVVALNPTTGAVLAHYSNPTFDPNVLSSHDGGSVLEAWRALSTDPAQPLLDRVTRETFAPGSTFKLVVAAAALERGLQPDTAFEDHAEYVPPQTEKAITNYSPGSCADGATISLAEALRVSCNTTFAELGVQLGADALIQTAERFGFNRDNPYVLPTVRSEIPKELDPPATAQSAIGQRDVRATPLEMAMLTAAIANDGQLMRPYVVDRILEPDGRTLRGPNSGPWQSGSFGAQAVTPRTSQLLQEMMVSVVDQGTGRRAAIPGVRVGGKTGTAELPNETPTVWFVGFADDDVAVAVVLPDAGEGATGGAVAAPIAKAVMETALGLR